MNYLNYALMLENKKFNGLTAIDEAKQNQNGLDLLLSGENSATYKAQFAQLNKAVKASKGKSGWSNAVINYADGSEMIKVYWYRDANGKYTEGSLTWDSSKTNAAPSPVPTSTAQNSNLPLIDDKDLEKDAQTLVDLLDGSEGTVGDHLLDIPTLSFSSIWVDEKEMARILQILQKYAGKSVKSVDGTRNIDALGTICFLYADDERGDLLYTDVFNVGTDSWSPRGIGFSAKKAALALLAPYKDYDLAKLTELYS